MMRRLITQTIAKIRNLRRSQSLDKELEREIALHVAMLEEEYERRGMPPAEARKAARQALGGVEQVKQAHRDQRGILWLEHTWQDLRHAWRTFGRNPGFMLVAVATLAVGIGVNTTLFTAYDAIALKPLPIADPGRVVRLERWFTHGWLGDMQYGFSWPEYLYYREHQDAFSDVVATSWPVRALAQLPGNQTGAQLKALQGQMVSGNYFRSFGVEAGVGRTFGPDEERVPGRSPVIVLSYSFWQRGFHGSPQAIGSLIRINGTAYSIIGVAPEEFTGTTLLPQIPDFWAPVSMQSQLVPGQDWLHQPADYHFQILGRLRPEIGVKQAEAETASLIRQFSATYVAREPT